MSSARARNARQAPAKKIHDESWRAISSAGVVSRVTSGLRGRETRLCQGASGRGA
jgi:hypothetical protein